MVGFSRAFLLSFAALILGFMQAFEPALAQQSDRRIITNVDSDYFGFDLSTERDVSLEQCKALCLNSLACAAFTYNVSAQFCFLKSDFGKLQPFEGAIAGRVSTTGEEPDIGAPDALPFISKFLRTRAEQFRERVASQSTPDQSMGFGGLLASAQETAAAGNIKGSVRSYTLALKLDDKNSEVWRELSDTASRMRSKNSTETRLYRGIALSSALNSYWTSRTINLRAKALASLARRLEEQRQYRPALSAYKQSLAVDEVAAVRTAYVDLRKLRGFRILNHTVDSDTKSPRACLQFSENIQKTETGIDAFVRLNGERPPSVDLTKKQVCIGGIEHGKNYKVTVRQGLPSDVGEALLADANISIYVRDRKPSARFTGNNFVLPYSGRQGIPLVTVNAASADMKLYRVGERALSQLFRQSRFLQQLTPSSADFLMGDIGEPIWNGSVDIQPQLNKEVVTSIPINQALPKREPGVYLLTASPKLDGPNTNTVSASQWFVVSDIGLTTFSSGGGLDVFTRSLDTAKPLADVELTLVARNNKVLATAKTDALGAATFDAGLIRGEDGLAPALITAKRGVDDFVLLDLSKAGFDFSDRGVTGLPAPKGVDVYAWTERGIYRAGETVHVAALARNPSVEALRDLPLTFIFTRPDGAEDRRIVGKGETLGGYAVQLPLTPNAQRGTWQVKVFLDPKAQPVAEKRFLVEDFLPEKTDFTLTPASKSIAAGEVAGVEVAGHYLYGAPAAGLTLEGELVVRSKRERSGFPGYLFGLASEADGSAQRTALQNPAPLDAAGETTLKITLPVTRATTRPQAAELVVRMREGSGRSVERTTTLDVVPNTMMLGIRPQFENGQVAEGSVAAFNVIAVDPKGQQTAVQNITWSLMRIERNYQWYRNGSSWNYESVDIETKVADGTAALEAQTPLEISAPVTWGRYRLDARSNSAQQLAASVNFSAGWFVEAKSTDTPDGLEIGLDKTQYKAGDVAKLKISPRFAGEMLVAIGTDRILETKTVSVPAEGTVVDITVGEDWGAGAYVLATLYRPGNGPSTRMPSRSIGVKWLSVDPEDKALAVTLGTPKQAKPREAFRVPIEVTNLEPGQEAYVMVAAVDVGILNLTNYQEPDPIARYFGQRKLGVDMRDVYGKLIDGSLGATGRLRTGGDGFEGMSTNGSAPTEKLVSFFSGPIRLDNEGKAVVEFDMPQFNGSVRTMAVVWSSQGVGSTSAETIVRDPVVITSSLPTFMAPGDQARLLVEVANTDAPSGSYQVTLQTSKNLSLADSASSRTVELVQGDKQNLVFPVIARSTGAGWALVTLTGTNGFAVENETAIKVRSGTLPVTQKIEIPLSANGGSLVVDQNLLSASELDGAKINISVNRVSAFDVPSLLLQLDRYPYGCAEQVTSKALPLLYASELSTTVASLGEDEVKKRIQKAIDTVLSYQSSNGGFSLWGGSVSDLWLGAYVSDFLTRAREKGYSVPEQPLRSSLQNLQNTLAYKNNLDENGDAIAYALYVLARNRMASAGDLRYYTDTQLEAFGSTIAKAQLGAAIALYGDNARADKAFGAALQHAEQTADPKTITYTYGSKLRDASAMLALATETRPEPSNTAAMTRVVHTLRRADRFTSTQEQAWMLLAARGQKLASQSIALNINGLPHQGVYDKRIEGADLAANPVQIANRTNEQLQATITTVAVPAEPLPAGGEGFTIKRTYYRLDGSEVNVSEVNQNERFVAVLSFKQLTNVPSRLIITDLLPAGFEIDNPNLVASAGNENFKWLPNTTVAHTEFRSDRFVAAFDRAKGGPTEFTVAYTVRAVTPGIYTHPAANIEDMYRPELSARTATGWMQVKAP